MLRIRQRILRAVVVQGGGLIDVLSVPGVTILLSLTVFHNLVAETLPQVSDAMPVLGIGSLRPYKCVDYSQNIACPVPHLCCTVGCIF